MKFAAVLGQPEEIQPENVDIPLPTGFAVLKHVYSVVQFHIKHDRKYKFNDIYYDVARTLIKCYHNRSLTNTMLVENIAK